jgi:S-formylglutathione hydrolase FrmB
VKRIVLMVSFDPGQGDYVVSKSDGRIVIVEHDSKVLRGNRLGDPHCRRFPVWLPAQYDTAPSKRRFPVLFDLVGYTGSGWSHTNWRNFDESVPQKAARLVRDRKMGPAIIVFPDCFTSVGGNQYINSSAIGRYADYLTRELIPFVDREFRTLADREHRGCFGKSSGGYGAMIHAMKYPAYWGAVANHSGDAYFDFVYRCCWPDALTELAKHRVPELREGKYRRPNRLAGLAAGHDDGRVRRFLDQFATYTKPTSTQVHTLMMIAMAASYDPAPSAPNGFRLPLDLETGEFISARWKKWLSHDPIFLVRKYRSHLQKMKGIFMDCGWNDQYWIQYGSRILSREFGRNGIAHTYQEFEGTHSSIDYRMDVSLPFLYRALKP